MGRLFALPEDGEGSVGFFRGTAVPVSLTRPPAILPESGKGDFYADLLT